MRKHWGFVSRHDSDGLVQYPIVDVSFSSDKLRKECQELVKTDYKDNFVGSKYARYLNQYEKLGAPHFDTIDDFMLYMKERVKEDDIYVKRQEWMHVGHRVHDIESILITIEKRGMPQELKHHASELLKAFRGELEKVKMEAKE